MKSQTIIFIFILQILSFGQKQAKIDWPSLANSPWPVLRGDMQGTGRSEFIGPRSCNIKWKKDMSLGIILGPVIGYDDVLFMGERAITADTFNYFFAVNKNSVDVWNFHTTEYLPNYSGPTLLGDSSIYFISGNKYLYSLDKNGKLKWTIYLGSFSWIQYSLDKNGNLYIPGNDTLRIISITGSMRKIYFPTISPSLSFSSGGDIIFAITGGPVGQSLSGTLTALDLNGNIYWSYNLGGTSWGIPLVDNQNNIYFFGSDTLFAQQDYLYCLKPNGTLKWKYKVNYYPSSYSPAMDHNGNLIFLNPIGNSGAIVSLDYNGNLRWIDTLANDQWSHLMDYGPVCDAEGKTYCGSNWPGGAFYCIDSNGVTLWKTIFPYEYDSCPAIGSDGTLYIGTHGSSLFTNHLQNLIAIRDSVTSVNDVMENVNGFQLNQNYPNPFNPSTTIKFNLPHREHVSLIVYDILGRPVTTLVNEELNAGEHSKEFTSGNLSSGIYIYRLQTPEGMISKKMILLK